MMNGLADIDELILRCRDERAKQYIHEAIACYKTGAFRSCIVATWIAVAYDIIDKLKELALTGDKQAEQNLERFERIRSTGDIAKALQFERELLDLSKEKFELISPIEYIDLSRLQEDRNRCAHPSMSSTEEVYAPTAELARLHLRNAVTALLQRQPVQGKAALERLLRDVESPYFSARVDEAIEHFRHGPLARPRESLTRNFIIVLVKKLLYEQLSEDEYRRYAAALNAVRQMEMAVVNKTLSERLSDLSRSIDHRSLNRVVTFIIRIGDTWQFLEPDVRGTVERYIKTLPSEHLGLLISLLNNSDLSQVAHSRLSNVTEDELNNELLGENAPEIIDHRIAIYVASNSYEAANRRAKRLIAYVSDFKREHVERILVEVSSNSQIRDSFELPTLIAAIRRSGVILTEEFNQLLIQHDLNDLS